MPALPKYTQEQNKKRKYARSLWLRCKRTFSAVNEPVERKDMRSNKMHDMHGLVGNRFALQDLTELAGNKPYTRGKIRSNIQ